MTDEELIEQLVIDLNLAHDELCIRSGLDPNRYDWPEWSSPANTIREAEKRLGKKLAKTNQWSEYSDGSGS